MYGRRAGTTGLPRKLWSVSACGRAGLAAFRRSGGESAFSTGAVPLSTIPADPAVTPSHRPVGVWLLVCCALVFGMVVLGGVTRLTDSGLSMVDWDPIMGAVPPLTDADWQAAFAAYRQYPEYHAINADMTVDEFKAIFLVEYAHRMWGRAIGVVFLLPFLVFLATRRLERRLTVRLAVLFVLGGAQGVLGWYMVQSGLIDDPTVSPYRLTAHLALAVVIYAGLLWTALEVVAARPGDTALPPPLHRRLVAGLGGLVFLTILSGGFVAGLDAGLTYNTFPLMDGDWVPEGYLDLTPAYLNLFENVAAVQFDHRLLAMSTLGAAIAIWAACRRAAAARFRRALDLVAALALLQVGLGIATLLLVVPVPLAAAHQAGALALLSAVIWAIWLGSPRPAADRR